MNIFTTIFNRHTRNFTLAMGIIIFSLPPCICQAAATPKSARVLPGMAIYGVLPIFKLTEQQPPSSEWVKDKIQLEVARNEAESFQIVFRPFQKMNNLKIQLNDFKKTNGIILSSSAIRVYKVEWVNINAPIVDTNGNPVDPTAAQLTPNYQPDPLWPIDVVSDCFSVDANKNLIFWLTITVPQNTSPGQYLGTVNILDSSRIIASLALNLKVRSFTLPKKPMLKSMISFSGDTGNNTKNVYDFHGAVSYADKDKLTRLYYDEFIRARFSPFLYCPAFSMLGQDIKRRFSKNVYGRYNGITVDFSAFDKEAEPYFNDFNAFSSFNLMGFLRNTTADGMPYLQLVDMDGNILIRDDENWALIPQNDRPTSPSQLIVTPDTFDGIIISFFRQVAKHLREKRWLDRTVLYIEDEPPAKRIKAMKQIAKLIRQADPSISTAAVIWDPTGLYNPNTRKDLLQDLVDINGKSLVDIWIPYCANYPAQEANYFPSKDAGYWMYDIGNNCLISQSGITNRAVFWDVWKRNCKGFLYYATTLWGINPWKYPNFVTQYNNRAIAGDGYFFYSPTKDASIPQGLKPVVPSIRWELMREGAEDYDYLMTLVNLINKAEGRTDLSVQLEQAKKALDYARSIGGTTGYYMLDEIEFCGLSDPNAISPLNDPSCDPIIVDLRRNGWAMSSNKHCTDKSSSGTCFQWLTSGNSLNPLNIKVTTNLPDGDYELILNVYNKGAREPGLRQSRFLVNGKEYGTTGINPFSSFISENVYAGIVTVSSGSCTFKISPVVNDTYGGLVLYSIGFKKPEVTGGIYTARQRVADAIESLQRALSLQ